MSELFLALLSISFTLFLGQTTNTQNIKNSETIKNTSDLPELYKEGQVALFEKALQ